MGLLKAEAVSLLAGSNLMHIYFINYHKFQGASGIHIHFLANTLVSMEIPCTVCVPYNKKSVYDFGEVNYIIISFFELFKKAIMRPKSFYNEDAIFHAWTPREIVRIMSILIVKRTRSPYFVHLEDNEEYIYETILDEKNAIKLLIKRIYYYLKLINPHVYKKFLIKSNGISCIIGNLECFAPQEVSKITFYPACEKEFFKMPDTTNYSLRNKLGIPGEALVVTYTGNIHLSNYDEVKTLYEAIKIINTELGIDIYLIHCGIGKINSITQEPYIIECGNIDPQLLYEYIRIADILVQPGRANRFNDYRFPSKLPMFLASGRPVILPNTNIGKKLEHGKNCLLLEDGSTQELVGHLQSLIRNKHLRDKIGNNGRSFARDNFDWEKSAAKLLEFYINNKTKKTE